MEGDAASKQRLSRLIAGWLRDSGYSASLEALQRECPDATEPEDGLPDLLRALEAFELARKPQTLVSGPLDVECSHTLPDAVTHTLDSIHAANILSVCYHELVRKRFDTSLADYVDERIACIVTTATDKSVKFTAMSDFEVVELLEPGEGPFLHAAIDPSGSRIALASMTGHLIVVDLESREVIFKTKDHAKYAVRVAYSVDGQYLASIGYDKTIRVYRCTEDYTPVWQLPVTTNPEAILFLPDGRLVISRRDSNLLIVVAPSDQWKVRLVNLNDNDDSHVSFSILAMALHPSRDYISLQTDTTNARILLLPLAHLDVVPAHVSPIARTLYTFAEQSDFTVARHSWLDDGTAVAVTSDAGLVRIVDVAHGLVRSTIRAHGDAAPGAAASRREGARPAGGGSGSSVVRDVCVLPLDKHGRIRVASVGFDRTIRIAEA